MILIINTTGKGLSFVLNNNEKHIDVEKQSIALASELESFLTSNDKDWNDLTAIGVLVGPGSFTGIRMGIAYAKGLGIGLNIPVVPVNIFELYLYEKPDAFVAIDSGRGDFFVAANGLPPCTMTIDEIETKQMQWPRTVGHTPFNLKYAVDIVRKKLDSGVSEPVIPMYLRPSYAETNKKC